MVFIHLENPMTQCYERGSWKELQGGIYLLSEELTKEEQKTLGPDGKVLNFMNQIEIL